MSSDGGTKWQVKNVEVTDNLYGINFLGSYEGYAAGAFGTIIKSSDSGSTWKLLTKIGGEAIKTFMLLDTLIFGQLLEVAHYCIQLIEDAHGIREAIDTQESLYGGYFADWGGWIVGDNGTVLSCCPISAVFDMSSTEFILGVTSEIIFNFKITVEGKS